MNFGNLQYEFMKLVWGDTYDLVREFAVKVILHSGGAL